MSDDRGWRVADAIIFRVCWWPCFLVGMASLAFTAWHAFRGEWHAAGHWAGGISGLGIAFLISLSPSRQAMLRRRREQ